MAHCTHLKQTKIKPSSRARLVTGRITPDSEFLQMLWPPNTYAGESVIAWCPDCGALRVPLVQDFLGHDEPERVVSQGIWLRPSDPRSRKSFVTATELKVPAARLKIPARLLAEEERKRVEKQSRDAAWSKTLSGGCSLGKLAARARDVLMTFNSSRAGAWVVVEGMGETPRAAAKVLRKSSAYVGRWVRKVRQILMAEAGQAAYDAYVAELRAAMRADTSAEKK